MKASTLTRLAPLADHSTLLLTHYGRKSGKAYVVTIWFVVDDGVVYLATMNRDRQWVRNIAKQRRVRLGVGGEHFDGEAHSVSGSKQMVAIYDLFARKYWAMWILDWIATLTLRNPRNAKKFDAGRGGFFRVELTGR